VSEKISKKPGKGAWEIEGKKVRGGQGLSSLTSADDKRVWVGGGGGIKKTAKIILHKRGRKEEGEKEKKKKKGCRTQRFQGG